MQIKPYDEIKINDVVNVTGLSVYNYTKLASKLLQGQTVYLRRDKSNKYDVNATGVYYDDQQIGWIPKASNSDFARHIPNNRTVMARVIAHNKTAPDNSRKLFIQIDSSELKAMVDNRVPLSYASSYAPSYYNDARKVFIDTDKTDAEKLQDLIEKTVTKEKYQEFKDKQPKEENKMNKLVNDTIARNSNNATSAAFLEAGRIANRQATKLASKHLPMMVRGYADTAGGRLVLANIAATAVAQFRPGDKRLARLADAMMVTAYQEVLQSFDIEKIIEDMLSNETIKAALNKVSENDNAGL